MHGHVFVDVRYVSLGVDLRPGVVAPRVRIAGIEHGDVGHGVHLVLHARVLAVVLRLVEDLVLPHVQVEQHDEEDDAVIEPFARDFDFHEVEADFVPVEAGQIDVERVGEVGEVPILHHDRQIHDQDERGQKRSGQLRRGEEIPV